MNRNIKSDIPTPTPQPEKIIVDNQTQPNIGHIPDPTKMVDRKRNQALSSVMKAPSPEEIRMRRDKQAQSEMTSSHEGGTYAI